MMNIITIVVKEDGYGIEAQSFNMDTQRGMEKAFQYFKETLIGYDVPHEENMLEYLFRNGGIRDAVEIIVSTL